jgi:hypothetical protein
MSLIKKLSLFLIMLISLLISSCSPLSSPANSITPTVLAVPTTTNVPTEVSTSTNNPDLTNLITNCVEILVTPPKHVKLRGSLALSSPSSESYILNLETNEKTFLNGSRFDELIVSPNMEKIAYIDYDTEKLIIYNLNSNESIVFDGFNDRFRLAQWVNNEIIVINKAKEDKPLYYHYSPEIFNLQTDDLKEFNLEDFPNTDKYSTGYPYFYPNPQMTKIVYWAHDAQDSIILFDMQSESQLKEIYFTEGIPKWTKDGKQFAISAVVNFQKYSNFSDDLPYLGGDEIFLVDATAKIRRLTFLATQYPNNYYSFLSWSHTEEHIAFNLQNITQPKFGLSILNMDTGGIVNYCIQNNWDYIYWSPDGKQVAFTRGNGFESYKATYILDLEKNLAFKVADNATVAGWVTNK